MILTMVMFMLESVYEAFFTKVHKKPVEKFFMLLLSPIWPVYTLFKTSLRQFNAEAYPSNSQKDIEEIEKLAEISNRAHLIEVKETLFTNVQNFYFLKIHLN